MKCLLSPKLNGLGFSIMFHCDASNSFTGIAMVQYSSIEDATAMLSTLHCSTLQGQKIRAQYKYKKLGMTFKPRLVRPFLIHEQRRWRNTSSSTISSSPSATTMRSTRCLLGWGSPRSNASWFIRSVGSFVLSTSRSRKGRTDTFLCPKCKPRIGALRPEDLRFLEERSNQSM